jgi:hypothetical protein
MSETITSDQVKLACDFSTLPGITIDEVRKQAGLSPHPDANIGGTTINMPLSQAEWAALKAARDA